MTTLRVPHAAIGVALVVAASGLLTARDSRAELGRAKADGVHAARVIGYSVDRRPIVAILSASGQTPRSMLVIGSIAGDEPGGVLVAKALARLPAVNGVALWLIPDMNPDGAAAGSRVNANGVDLNRNFPFRWRRLADSDSRYYPGSRPASEPESRAVAAFIRQVRPGLTVWLHEPYGVIDDSQGPRWAEQLASSATGLPLERLADYPGSAIGWEDHLLPGSAFDLELPVQPLTGRYVAALRRIEHAYALRPLHA